jgi:hypothetical protein
VGHEITRRQATFRDLRHDGRLERIHFLGKEEFAFVEPSALSFSIVEQHPLLIDYEFAWETIYIAGPADAPDHVLRTLTEAIEARADGWRSATSYLNPVGDERILRDGYGNVLAAPISIAEVSRDVLDAAGVPFTSLPGRPPRWPRQALIAGVNHVVAKSFRVEVVVS